MYSMFRLNSGFNKDTEIRYFQCNKFTCLIELLLSTILVDGILLLPNMTKMFRTASAFNQDLSGWCVPNISSLPDNFKTQSPLSDDNTPVWGTCPSPSVSLTHDLPPARSNTANGSETFTIFAQFSASMSSSPTVPTINISDVCLIQL